VPAISNPEARSPHAAEAETSGLSSSELARYSRHLRLPEVGLGGQRRLKAARVIVVGAGGLGSPAAMYLAAAGVGTIGLVDDDRVELTNLQRQLLHDTADVGRPKTESARDRLLALNPEIDVRLHTRRLASENALSILGEYDVIVDGSDNFPTRYLVNDAAVILGLPLVYGAIFRFEGQASVFAVRDGPCYRCLFREPPPPELAPNCAEAGVLGVLPGLVGSIQATETLKLILGRGRGLAGRLLLVDALDMEFRQLRLRRDPECAVCGERPSIHEPIDYEHFCATASAAPAGVPDIEAAELARSLAKGEPITLIDVREPFEWAICNLGSVGARLIPHGQLGEHIEELRRAGPLVLYCRSGVRSAEAVRTLLEQGLDDVRNLRGGILAWSRDVDAELQTY
jgi:molybdopterin/thiamine biosynthesis adenylyltransferase/rhodanese-related sulfurtransferase